MAMHFMHCGDHTDSGHVCHCWSRWHVLHRHFCSFATRSRTHEALPISTHKRTFKTSVTSSGSFFGRSAFIFFSMDCRSASKNSASRCSTLATGLSSPWRHSTVASCVIMGIACSRAYNVQRGHGTYGTYSTLAQNWTFEQNPKCVRPPEVLTNLCTCIPES